MTKPYMPSRWAIRRRGLQNSADVSTSAMPVWMAMPIFSPPETGLAAPRWALRIFSKKNLALPLCTMSNSVPSTTNATMTMTNACITVGEMDAESAANGLLVNIQLPQS